MKDAPIITHKVTETTFAGAHMKAQLRVAPCNTYRITLEHQNRPPQPISMNRSEAVETIRLLQAALEAI